MEKLYSFYIHYNNFTGYWCAIDRSKSGEYLNGTLKDEEIIKSKNVQDLIKYICK